MSFCQIGDFPAVYYKFSGQSDWQKVQLAFAPLNIEVEPVNNDGGGRTGEGGGTGGGGSGGSSGIPCPPEGAFCRITATTQFLWPEVDESVDYENRIGYCHRYSSGIGWGFEECVVGEENDPNRFDSQTGEPYLTYRWSATATTTYYFRKGLARPVIPNDYYPEQAHPGGWSYSDSCFPNGGDPLTCTSEDDVDNDGNGNAGNNSKKENQELIRIKIIHNNQVIWQATGKNPANYSVTCDKNKCPPDFLKLPASNPQGFCCIPCAEIRNEISQIKSLLRQNNG